MLGKQPHPGSSFFCRSGSDVSFSRMKSTKFLVVASNGVREMRDSRRN